MSTTTDTNTRAERGPCLLSALIGRIRKVWQRWQRRHRKASGCFTIALLALAACASANTSSPAAAAPCPGSVSLAWFLVSARGQPATCAEVGATSVALRLQSRSGGATIFTAAPCSDTSGVFNVAPGLYDISVELHDRTGVRLATAPVQTSIPVAVGRTRVLAPALLQVTNRGGGGGGGGGSGSGDPQSHIGLTLKALGFESNCGPASADGASITNTAIVVEKAGGAGCVPVQFIRHRDSANGPVISSYFASCMGPDFTSCIEEDEVLTAPGLAPGSYIFHVLGDRGTRICFAGDAPIDLTSGQSQPLIFLQRLFGC